jgi:hypothetical protein
MTACHRVGPASAEVCFKRMHAAHEACPVLSWPTACCWWWEQGPEECGAHLLLRCWQLACVLPYAACTTWAPFCHIACASRETNARAPAHEGALTLMSRFNQFQKPDGAGGAAGRVEGPRTALTSFFLMFSDFWRSIGSSGAFLQQSVAHTSDCLPLECSQSSAPGQHLLPGCAVSIRFVCPKSGWQSSARLRDIQFAGHTERVHVSLTEVCKCSALTGYQVMARVQVCQGNGVAKLACEPLLGASLELSVGSFLCPPLERRCACCIGGRTHALLTSDGASTKLRPTLHVQQAKRHGSALARRHAMRPAAAANVLCLEAAAEASPPIPAAAAAADTLSRQMSDSLPLLPQPPVHPSTTSKRPALSCHSREGGQLDRP